MKVITALYGHTVPAPVHTHTPRELQRLQVFHESPSLGAARLPSGHAAPDWSKVKARLVEGS